MQELATSNSPCLSQPDQFATILLHLSRQVTPDPEVVRSGYRNLGYSGFGAGKINSSGCYVGD